MLEGQKLYVFNMKHVVGVLQFIEIYHKISEIFFGNLFEHFSCLPKRFGNPWI